MKTVKYFNVYHGIPGLPFGDICFIERDSKPVSSLEDRTVTGPYSSLKEAQESFANNKQAKKYFLFTEQVVFDLK